MPVASHLNIDLNEYDARIRTFVPDYDEMLTAAAGALEAATRPIRSLVDLGTGTGALVARIARVAPRAAIVGIDEDEGMLRVARRRSRARRVSFVRDSFLHAPFPACDAVTASLALHHVQSRRTKKALYVRAGKALGQGGVLVSADCHPSSLPELAAAGRTAWRDHLAREYGRKGAEAFLHAWSEEDFYVPLDDELQIIRAAGFAADVVWRRGSFAVIAAQKL